MFHIKQIHISHYSADELLHFNNAVYENDSKIDCKRFNVHLSLFEIRIGQKQISTEITRVS